MYILVVPLWSLMISITLSLTFWSRSFAIQLLWNPMCTLGRLRPLPRLGGCIVCHACSALVPPVNYDTLALAAEKIVSY